MVKLFRYFTKKEWGLAGLALCFVVIQVWLDLTTPDYMSKITILVQTEGSAMSDIMSTGGKMLLCAFGSLFASFAAAICAAKIAAEFSSCLRSNMFRKILSFSMGEIGKFSTASLITRSTNDITQVQTVIVMGLQVMIKAPITAVWAICKISGKEWQWITVTGAAVLVLLIVVGTCIFLAFPKFRKLQMLTDDLNRVTRENLTGIRVVRAYNAEQYQENKFEKVNQAATETNLFTMRTMAFMTPSIQMVMSGLTLAIYWVGAILINQAGATDKTGLFADMMVFSQYAIQVVMAFMMVVIIFMVLPRASVSANRILKVLDAELSVSDGTKENGKTEMNGSVEFRNVSFRYPDADKEVIHNISFTANKGETIAIIGSTGCGKSTVINLIPRFYDATEGEILIDGINVKEYSQNALRNKIGYVSQKAILYSGTIFSNVAYGNHGGEAITQEDVEKAIETAQAVDIVQNTDGGYYGYVAQGGSNLSGGQKQRISIARAIARKPEILIFDDSFSALDYRTDRNLRVALNNACGDSTRIIVAQRIGTIRDADKIIVLDEGKITGIGTHNELMMSCKVYQQIAHSQLSKEELA